MRVEEERERGERRTHSIGEASARLLRKNPVVGPPQVWIWRLECCSIAGRVEGRDRGRAYALELVAEHCETTITIGTVWFYLGREGDAPFSRGLWAAGMVSRYFKMPPSR